MLEPRTQDMADMCAAIANENVWRRHASSRGIGIANICRVFRVPRHLIVADLDPGWQPSAYALNPEAVARLEAQRFVIPKWDRVPRVIDLIEGSGNNLINPPDFLSGAN